MAVDTSGVRAAIQTFAEEVAAKTAERALELVRPGVPVRDGELRASEFNRTSGTTVSIGYEAEHASYTDEGTAPHEIHGNPWLVFEGNEGIVFLNDLHGNFVQHPGTSGTGWWTDIIGGTDTLDGLIDIANTVAAETSAQA